MGAAPVCRELTHYFGSERAHIHTTLANCKNGTIRAISSIWSYLGTMYSKSNLIMTIGMHTSSTQTLDLAHTSVVSGGVYCIVCPLFVLPSSQSVAPSC